MRTHIITFLFFSSLFVSCAKETVPDGSTVTMDLLLDEVGKLSLNDADAFLKSGRVWKWDEGDVLTYCYKIGSEEKEIKSTKAEVDAKNPSLLHVTISSVPKEAAFTRVIFGSGQVFGETCIGGSDIPSTLVYAENAINAEPGTTKIPGVTLDHKCSYFLIYPDMVTVGESSAQIRDVEVRGHGLTGKDTDETIIVSLYDETSRSCQPHWLALSNKAENLVFTADYGSGKAEMATVASAGSGKCKLFEISNKSIGLKYE